MIRKRTGVPATGARRTRFRLVAAAGACLALVFVTAATAAAPVAVDDSATVTKNQTVTIFVLENDSDADGDFLSITSPAPTAAHGTVDCSSTSFCVYTPEADYVGPDTFDYTVSDGSEEDTGTVTVDVVENQPPMAVDDAATATEGNSVVVNVLDNDTDPDFGPDSLTVTSPSPSAANGTVACDFFSCTYTPNAGFLGTDTFDYTISDGAAGDTGTVTVTVEENEPPVAEDDALQVIMNSPGTVFPTSNDFDPNGDNLTITSPAPTAAHGTVSCDAFSCTYTSDANYLGPDSFDYTVSDGSLSDTGTVNVTVVAPCFPAVCIDNDTVLLAVRPEGHLNVDDGTGSEAGPGAVGLHFIPTGNEATAPGCLCEGWGAADAGTGITGYANVATDGGANNMTVESFTSTDSTALSVVNIQDTLRVTHDYHPSPDTPNLYEVTVTIRNITGGPLSDIRYRRVMDWDIEPTAFSEFVTINGGNASELLFDSNNGFATANPLGGPSDLGFTGNFVDEGPADHGALFDFGFGALGAGEETSFNIFYGAAPDETGANSAVAASGAEVYSYGQPSSSDPQIGTPNTFIFAFGGVGGDPILAPDAVDDTLTTDENTPATVNVLANDTDPNGDPLIVTGSSDPAHGSASCTPAGDCTYTPDAGYTGPDSFTYDISDGTGGTDTATVHVTVNPVNAAPVANDDTLTTDQDTPGSVNVLANDTDADGDTLTVTAASDPAHGSVSCTPAGDCTYTPDAGYSGPDSFTYDISDGNGGTDTATVNVTVVPVAVNNPPVANDDTLTTGQDVPATVNVLLNDTDPDGDTVAVTSWTAGAHGTVSCTAAGDCTYTPDAGYNGPDSFTYTISDGHGGTDTATVNVVVQPVADGGRVRGKGSFQGTSPGRVDFEVDASDAGGLFNFTVNRNRFVATTVTDFVRAGNTASFEGTGTWRGAAGFTYEVSFVDNGTPGRLDTIEVVVRNAGGAVVFTSGGPKLLKTGNVIVSD